MDDRIVQFIAGLRAAGVRVSLAESQDAILATQAVGVMDRGSFKAALRAALVKEQADHATFERLFRLYFRAGRPPLSRSDDVLSPEEAAMLQEALQALAGRLSETLRRLLEGQGPPSRDIEAAIRRAGLQRARHMVEQRRLTRSVLGELGLDDLLGQIEALLQMLGLMGMSREALERLASLLQSNVGSIAEQVDQEVGAALARHLAETKPPRLRANELLDQPFDSLRLSELDALRREATRLAARLRTRAALRMRRGEGRLFDAKGTLRTNVRHGNVPFELLHRERRRKARFTVLCDVSTSMRPAVDFLLLLVYQMQDQVGRTRSFAFIDHLEEISTAFDQHRPEVAIPEVLRRLPPGHYNTDYGFSLAQFAHDHPDAVDRRTTLIICGDGRNNNNDPRADLLETLARRARKTVWFDPEPQDLWATGDSQIPLYAPLVNELFQVSNLRELAEAVDRLFL